MPDYPDGVQVVQVAVTVDNVIVLPQPANERAIAGYGNLSTSSASYQTVTSWTVAAGKGGVLSGIEIACDNYTIATWKLVVAGVTVFIGITIPSRLTKPFPNLLLAAGDVVIISVHSDGVVTINTYADIDGKEQG